MGRTILLENYVERILSSLPYSSSGILLGQTFENKDYTVMACKCPPDESDEEVSQVNDPLDEVWITNHCRNLLRMLPGGLTIQGFFWIAKHDSFRGKESHIKEILASLYRCEKTAVSDNISLCEPIKSVIVMDPNSKKMLARTVVTDSCGAMEMKPADVKIQSFLDHWHVARSTVDLNLSLPLPPHQNQSCFARRLVNALKPFMEHILSAEGRISSAVDLASPLSSVPFSGGSSSSIDVVLYHCPDPQEIINAAEAEAAEEKALLDQSDEEVANSSHCVRVSGKIPALGILHTKSTGEDAVKALKTDIIRSLCGRITLLLEELEVTEEVEDFHVEQTLLPQRVLVRLPRMSHRLILSDYKFHSETREDVISRVVYFCGLEALYNSDNNAGGDREDDDEESSGNSACSVAEGIGLELDLDLEQCYPPELSESDVETLASEDERMVEKAGMIDWRLLGLVSTIFFLLALLVTLFLNS